MGAVVHYQIFGNTGLKVSELCLGAMTFGEEWGWGGSEEQSRAVFDAFVEAGGNFIDAADVYTGGTSERLLGKFMGAERDRFVVATKFTAAPGAPDPNAVGNGRKHIMRAVEASLERLGTDYIDVYWLHAWDYLTPIEEVMQAFDDLVRSGKVLYVGLSDTPSWVVARGQTLAELRGSAPLAGIQIQYSLSERGVETDFFSLAETLDLAICCWSPLDQGLLSGKFGTGAGASSDSKRSGFHGGRIPEAKQPIVAELERIARDLGCRASQLALRWIRQRSPRSIPIVGARTPAQIEENLGATAIELPAELFQRLERVSRVAQAWPHGLLSSPAQVAFTYGGFFDRIRSERPLPIAEGGDGGLESYVSGAGSDES
jgi:aryl-alcohol dehydrogenase-like predicted oxidoreductase